MTHEQYLAIYERERKKSSSVADAAHIVFKALHREICYRVSEKREKLISALHYANTIWQFIASRHNELKPDGFKNMTRLFAEKSDDKMTKQEVLKLLELL